MNKNDFQIKIVSSGGVKPETLTTLYQPKSS